MPIGFRYALYLEDGEPADPVAFVTATPQWREGDRFMPRGGQPFRIVRIEPSLDEAAMFDAVWVVESLPG